MAVHSFHLKRNCMNVDVTSNLKQLKCSNPVVKQSKSIIESRSLHPSSFSAWIECFKDTVTENYGGEQPAPGPAQIDAQEMQAKIDQIEKDRKERLMQFQQEVGHRVKVSRRKKQQEQMNKSIAEFSKESKVICQSAFPKRIPSAIKNSCSFRSNITADKIKNIMTGEANTDSKHNIHNSMKSSFEIDQKAQLVKSQSSQARAGLVSKKVAVDMSQLPGGVWGQQRNTCNDEQNSDEHPSTVLMENISNECDKELRRQKGNILNDMWKGFDIDEEEERKHEENIGENACSGISIDVAKSSLTEKKKIRFNLPGEDKEEATKVAQSTPTTLTASISKPAGLIKPPIRMENDQIKENNNQYWTYRKLFMDIEREKVRETQRRRKHKKVISKLKHEKETERNIMEKEVEVCLPSECKARLVSNCVIDDPAEKKEPEKHDDSKRTAKKKEMNRYIDALKNLIREKMDGKEKGLPSICSCENTLLDSHPDTCANNCIFYRNSKEYARVLSSVLSTMD